MGQQAQLLSDEAGEGRPERESEAVWRSRCSQPTAARAPGTRPGSGGAGLLLAPLKARKCKAELKCQTVTAAVRPVGDASQASASLLTALSLFSFTQQNRTSAFQSRNRWLPPPLPRPPPAGLCRKVCFPGGRGLGTAGGGHLARMLQDRGGPAPRWPHTAGTPWLSLVSQKTDAAPPSPGPVLRLAPSRTLSGGPGRPARPLLGRRPASDRQVGTCPGAVACCLRGPHAHFL